MKRCSSTQQIDLSPRAQNEMFRRRENRWEEEIAENEWKIPREAQALWRQQHCFRLNCYE